MHDALCIIAGVKPLLQLSNIEYQADKKSRKIHTFALALEIRDLLSFIEGKWSPSGDALVRAPRDEGLTTHVFS